MTSISPERLAYRFPGSAEPGAVPTDRGNQDGVLTGIRGEGGAALAPPPPLRRAFPPLDAMQRRLNICRYCDPFAVIAATAAALFAAQLGAGAYRLVALPITDVLALGALPPFAVLALRVAGLYQAERYLRGRSGVLPLLVRLGGATLAAAALLIGMDFALHGAIATRVLPHGTLVWAAMLVAVIGVRGATFALTAPWLPARWHQVLLVGTGPRAMRLYRDRYAGVADRVQLLGMVTPTTTALDQPAPPTLGTVPDLEVLLARRAVDEVLVALPLRFCYADIQETFEVCARMGVPATYIDDVLTVPELTSGRERPIEPLAPMPHLRAAPQDYRLLVKRAIDVICSITGVVVLAPILLLTALAIKLTSRGPIIFRQRRYGLNRRLFTIYKFRTMVCGAEEQQHALEAHNEADGPVFKIREDPRMTPIGRVLRRTSIDELPQLFNVILGNMSLVGPRPLPTRDVERFSESWFMRRFSVLPGITGPWQVSGRSDLSFGDWVRLDLDYIDHWSLRRDFRLLLQTVPAVLRGHGAA